VVDDIDRAQAQALVVAGEIRKVAERLRRREVLDSDELLVELEGIAIAIDAIAGSTIRHYGVDDAGAIFVCAHSVEHPAEACPAPVVMLDDDGGSFKAWLRARRILADPTSDTFARASAHAYLQQLSR
jgi:hypothetical protein